MSSLSKSQEQGLRLPLTLQTHYVADPDRTHILGAIIGPVFIYRVNLNQQPFGKLVFDYSALFHARCAGVMYVNVIVEGGEAVMLFSLHMHEIWQNSTITLDQVIFDYWAMGKARAMSAQQAN